MKFILFTRILLRLSFCLTLFHIISRISRQMFRSFVYYKQLLFALLLFLPVSSYGEVDFEGFFRVRGTALQSSDLLKGDTLFSSGASILDQTLSLEASLYPNKSFDIHLLFWSSFYHTSFSQDKLPFTPSAFLQKIHPYKIYTYGSWNINHEMKLSFGRRTYELDLPQLISTNIYEAYPSIFDGVFFTYGTEFVILDIWAAQIPDLWRGAEQIESDEYGLGLSLDLRFSTSFLKRAYLAFSYLPTSEITRMSLGIQGAIRQLSYMILVAGHGEEGLKFKFKDQAYHMEAVYSRNQWFGSRFFGGYHQDTLNYDPWLYDRHSQAGFLDILEWGNLSYFFGGYRVSFPHLFELEFQYLNFSNEAEGPIHLGYYGDLAFHQSPSPSYSKGSIGQEFDVKITKSLQGGLDFIFSAGFFLPDDRLSDFLGSSHYQHLQLTSLYHF